MLLFLSTTVAADTVVVRTTGRAGGMRKAPKRGRYVGCMCGACDNKESETQINDFSR